MIAIVRIAGEISLNGETKETLSRLRLRKKYSCVVLKEVTPVQQGMIKRLRDFIAYGEIDDATYKELVKKRGKMVEGKLKPFFRLHPARGGIDSKKHYGETSKGVLGNNGTAINDLIRRML